MYTVNRLCLRDSRDDLRKEINFENKEFYMYPNPFTGRSNLSGEYPPTENGTIQPDPNLTIAVVVFCIVGPFWLIYRLVEFVVKRSVLFTSQTLQKMKEFSKA